MATTMAGARYTGFTMRLIGLAACVIHIALVSAEDATVRPPGGECETRFMEGLFKCFVDVKVPFNTYLWAVTNGAGGIPPDDRTTFRQQMCSVEEKLVQCVLDSLHALVDTPFCSKAQGMETVLTVQVRTILEEYDNYCADDCRFTLKEDLKQCYRDNGLKAELFVPDDGAIMGYSSLSADHFCTNREKLVTCMKTKIDRCKESTYVLKKIGLDLDIFNSGIELLCKQKDVYISSLDCFSEQTRAVEKCSEDNALALKRLVSNIQQNISSFSQEQILPEFCTARIKYIQCDLTSWQAKTGEACNRAALTLKRDLHCGQIPDACKQTMDSAVDELCTGTYGRLPVAHQSAWEWVAQDSGASSVQAFSALLFALPVVMLAWNQ